MVRHRVSSIESRGSSVSPERAWAASDPASQVLPTSSMGVFDHDVRTNAVYCSPEVHEIYGWPAGSGRDPRDVRRAHPSRRPRAAHGRRGPRPRPRRRRPLQLRVPHRPRRRRGPLGEHARADVLRRFRRRPRRRPRHRRDHRRHRRAGRPRTAAGSRGPPAPRRDAGAHGPLHARRRRRRRRLVRRQQGAVRVQPRLGRVIRRSVRPPAPRRRAASARRVCARHGDRRRVRDRVPRRAAGRRRGDDPLARRVHEADRHRPPALLRHQSRRHGAEAGRRRRWS